MDTPHPSAAQLEQRLRDRLQWAALRPPPRARRPAGPPLSVRLKRLARDAALSVPFVGPGLLTRLRLLKAWLARRLGPR